MPILLKNRHRDLAPRLPFSLAAAGFMCLSMNAPVRADVPPVAQNAPQASPGSVTLDEVVVTASKRAEPLREVAASITALTGENLEALGAQNLKDYIGRAPGVQFQGSEWSYGGRG